LYLASSGEKATIDALMIAQKGVHGTQYRSQAASNARKPEAGFAQPINRLQRLSLDNATRIMKQR